MKFTKKYKFSARLRLYRISYSRQMVKRVPVRAHEHSRSSTRISHFVRFGIFFFVSSPRFAVELNIFPLFVSLPSINCVHMCCPIGFSLCNSCLYVCHRHLSAQTICLVFCFSFSVNFLKCIFLRLSSSLFLSFSRFDCRRLKLYNFKQ